MEPNTQEWQVGDLAKIIQNGQATRALLLNKEAAIWVTEGGDCIQYKLESAEFMGPTGLRYRYMSWEEVLIDFELDFFAPYFSQH